VLGRSGHILSQREGHPAFQISVPDLAWPVRSPREDALGFCGGEREKETGDLLLSLDIEAGLIATPLGP
jgi:hypothetical protein